MSEPVSIGVIGCGNISGAYFNASKSFGSLIRITKVADLNQEAARKKAEEHGYQTASVAEILADPEIKIVLNLTTPQSHTAINTDILNAGKHSYSEKPFGLTRESGLAVLKLAEKLGLQTGSAPDTFLGGGQQCCRKLIDDGAIGKVIAGTAFMMCHGHEGWHPAPAFYYLKGGGPLFDMGPYYLTTLVNMLGPVKSVIATGGRALNERTCTAAATYGQKLPVEINTHVAGVLTFESGALITLVVSFDVWRHTNHNIELHGTEGSMRVPDPNCFGGEIKIFQPWMNDWVPVKTTHGYTDNMRSIGLADMARSLTSRIPARCSGKLAYHVLDVMCSLEESAATGRSVELASSCERPAALPAQLAAGTLGE